MRIKTRGRKDIESILMDFFAKINIRQSLVPRSLEVNAYYPDNSPDGRQVTFGEVVSQNNKIVFYGYGFSNPFEDEEDNTTEMDEESFIKLIFYKGF